MSSRAVVIVLVALAISPIANAGQSSIEVLPHHAIALDLLTLRPELSLSDLFSSVGQAPSGIRDDGSLDASIPSVDVIVARVDADGRLVTACFHDEDSAKAFLEAKRRPLVMTPEDK